MKNEIRVMLEDQYVVIVQAERKYRIDRNEWCVEKDGVSCPFTSAEKISVSQHDTTVEHTLSLIYERIMDGLSLRVDIRVDLVHDRVLFTLTPLQDEAVFDVIRFPGSIDHGTGKLVIPLQQGVLLDTEDPCEFSPYFGGYFACADAYVNALGYYGDTQAYLWIVDSYYDACYQIKKKERQQIHIGTLSSLAHLRYPRTYTLLLSDGSMDYNCMAKHVRKWYEDTQTVTTLKQKMDRKPVLKQLVGSCVYHTGIHSDISPDSRYYHSDGKNEAIVPIDEIRENLKGFHEAGVGKIHLHLDGCGIAYDRKHPCFDPIDERTGGYPALVKLMDAMHEDGDILTLHDNYHDLYFDSPDYDDSFRIYDRDGNPYYMAVWAGGKQSYLTARMAPVFFERNLNLLKGHGVISDGVYCDVFTCNPQDENFNPCDLQDRTQCARYRNMTFDVFNNRGGMTSSEEVNGFAVNHVDTCHYAPYPFRMTEDGKQAGLPIPFFNLVFHDCVVIPWMSDVVNGVNYGLYALLNGGIAYLKRDGAYVNTDGSFSQDYVDENRIELVNAVSALHEKVACAKMVQHRFIDDDPMHQETVFDHGIRVEINLHNNTYQIHE